MTRHASLALALALIAMLSGQALLHAHSGPPYPIVSNRIVGAYDISIWTDPDSTDDKTAAGRFWIVLDAAARGGSIPAGTQVHVAIHAVDRPGPVLSGAAAPVDGLITRQYIALLMDHEGPFTVTVTVEGPLGQATVESHVDATYDLRPAPLLLIVFLFPFVAVGALWVKVLLRRRSRATPPKR